MPLKSTVAALLTKKSAFALILVSTVALGAGFGAIDSPFGGESSQTTDQTVFTNSTSTPDPTVTPPPTESPDNDGKSDQQSTATATPSVSTEEPEEADESDDDDRSERSNDRRDRSNGNAACDADLSLSVGTPGDVRSDDGSIDAVEGRLSGSVSWKRANVDTVVFVVSGRTPDGEWREVRRETRALDGERTVDLRTAFGDDSVAYADGEQTAAFANADDGTTVERTGRVGITAVLFDGQREVVRVTETGSYTFEVTNIEATVEASAESEATASALGSAPLTGRFF